MMWFKNKSQKSRSNIVHSSLRSGNVQCGDDPIRPYVVSQGSSALRLFLYTSLVLVSLIVIPIAVVQSAQSTFVQSDWLIEKVDSIKVAPFSSWTEYRAKDTGVVGGADIRLQPVNYELIQESDDGTGDTCASVPGATPAIGCSTGGGLNAGTFNKTAVYDTGTAAQIKLSTTADDGRVMTSFGTAGVVKSNPGTGTDLEGINAITHDGNHVYMAGYDSSLGADQQWRIEKRNIISGASDSEFGTSGAVVVNPYTGSDDEQITAIAVDATHVYVAGYASNSGDSKWRIEKRQIGDGSLESGFGSGGIVEVDPSTSSDRIYAMAIDATHLYVAGYDSSQTDLQWRIEKRKLSDGTVESGFGTNGVVESNLNAGEEEIYAIAIDASYVYAAGYEGAPGDTKCRIEKRHIGNGALETGFDTDGILLTDPSTGPDHINSIAVNATHIFVAGQDNDPGNTQWRIEKRNIGDGSLETGFDTDGIVLSNPSTGSDFLKSIVIDADYIYAGGFDHSQGDYQWRIENRDITTGALIAAFGTNGVIETNQNANDEKIYALLLDGRYLFAAGFEFTFGSPRWRLEKRVARQYETSGTYESPVLDLGAAQDISTITWFPPNAPPNTTLTMHVQAGTTATPDCPGTCADWIDWTLATNNSDTGATFDGKQYVKYRASLTTEGTNTTNSPRMFKMIVRFTSFPIGAGLESSVFDTGNANNFLKSVSWTEMSVAPNEGRIQVATSGDNVNWVYCGMGTTGPSACSTAGWLDFTAGAGNYYTSGLLTNPLSSDAINDRFFKYKIWLAGDGTGTPAIDDITIIHDTAALGVYDPSINTTYSPSPTAGIPFDIVVRAEDSDNVPLIDRDNLVTIRFTASSPQPDMNTCVSSFTNNGNTQFSSTGLYSSGVMTITGVVLCDASTSSFTISAQEISGGGLNSSSDLTISAVNLASPLELGFSIQPPASFLMSSDLVPAPEIVIQDTYGNVDTTDNSTSISLSAYLDSACTATAASGVFNSGSPLTVSAGLVSFPNINYDITESIYIKATGGSLTACSNAIAIADAGFSVQIDVVVDYANDALIISSSLLQNGVLVTDNAKMSLTKIEVLDETGTSMSGNLNGSGTSVTDLTNSIYHTTWDPSAGIDVDEAYSIVAEITYDTVLHQGLKIYSLNQAGIITADLKDLGDKLDGVQTTVTAIDTKAGTVDTDIASLDTKLTAYEAKRAAHRITMNKSLSTITANVGKILEDTSKTIPDLLKSNIATELAKGAHSEIVTTQATVKTGTTMPFRFRTATGLKPTLTVFDPNESARVAAVTMKEVGGTGIYIHNITFSESWGVGNFMVRVNESTKKTVDNIILNVIAAKEAPKSTGAVSSSIVTIDTLYSRMNKINSTVSSLTSSVDTVKGNTDSVGTDIDDLLEKVTKGKTSTVSGESLADAQKLSKYLTSVSSIIGTGGGTTDFRTILGKLNGIEVTLENMGDDAAVAAGFNENAKQKAERIKSFVAMVMKEIKEEGKVEDPEEKVEIIEEYLTDLKETVKEIPTAVTTGSISETVTMTLEELEYATDENEGLKELVPLVEQELVEVTEIKTAEDLTTTDLIKMRNDVSGLKSLMLEVRGLLDEEVNAPVVHGWLEGE